MKKYVACIALALMASAAHAQLRVTAGLGLNIYDGVDGRWQQQGVPGGSDVTTHTPAITLGIAGPIVSRGRWGIDWHADYLNLGRAAASCMCTPMDQNYDPHTHHYSAKFDVPMAYFSGSGRSQGVGITAESYYWIGGARIGVEAGAYVHHDAWSEYVAGWQVPRSIPAQTFNLSDSYWSVAPMVGLSVGNDRWAVSYRHLFMSLNSRTRNTPPLWNDADLLSVTYKW